ncbi:MAG: hypothetical protein JXB88_05180 [Spirochaetales bacterium]|nr:hypothetical protein [Spirochaetales bacterium]
MKNALLFFIILCGKIICPECEELYSTGSNVSSFADVFSVNRITDRDSLFILQKFYVLETKLEEDRYILDDLPGPGFLEYNGTLPVHDENIKRPMYTLRTGFYIDNGLKGEKLSLYTRLIGYPRNIYLNGQKIHIAGKYGENHNNSSIFASNIYLSNDILHYGNRVNELAVQLYPEGNSISMMNLGISSYYRNAVRVFIQNFIGVNLVQAGVIAAFILFVYFFFLFITMGKKNTSYLYFGLTCLFFGFASFNMCFHSDGISQLFIDKVSRCSFPWLLMNVAFFSMEFTKIMNKKLWLKIVIIVFAIILTIVTVVQKSIGEVNSVFTLTMLGFIAPLLLLSIIVLFISLIKDKRKDSIIILFAFTIIIGTAAHDIYYVAQNLYPYSYLMQFGFFSLVISIFFLLAYENSKLFMTSLKTSGDLNIKNKSLNEMVRKIFAVSESLSSSGEKLEKGVHSSTELIQQYEDNNKKIMATVLNRLDDVESMMIKIGERIDISIEKIPQAIINQTAIVEEVSATITQMNSHMAHTMENSNKSNSAARHLSVLAEKSRDMILESRDAISKISEYSQFLNDVLVAIQDISDRTNVLSINAAIEAARQGKSGKGFSVIAGEIGSLSQKSKGTLETSFEKIKSMYEIIERSTLLSDEVSASLLSMITKIKESSTMIHTITDLIQEQKSSLSEILISVENLLQDTFTIKNLSEEEYRENEKIKNTLSELKTTLSTITGLIKNQLAKGSELYSFIGRIKEITDENLENVDILRKTTAS